MKNTRWCLLISILMGGCEQPPSTPPPPRPALVTVIGNRSAQETLSLAGQVRPRYESSQGFRIAGKIVARLVDVGDTVKKNQTLAKLDPSDLSLNVTSANADVKASETDFALASAELARYENLYRRHFISASALDVKKADVKTAQARLAQTKAAAEVAYNQTEYANLRADRNGIINMIRAEPGQVVDVGETVALVSDTSVLEVMVAVPESKMSEIRLNDPVKIKLWAQPQIVYSGKVREIAPEAEPSTRAFNVRVTIDNPDQTVKLGMTARVRFAPETEAENHAFLIPASALTEIGGKPTVWVIDAENKAQPRTVEAGNFTEEGVLIYSGLQAGEKIASVGVHTLVKDQQVKPVFETAP